MSTYLSRRVFAGTPALASIAACLSLEAPPPLPKVYRIYPDTEDRSWDGHDIADALITDLTCPDDRRRVTFGSVVDRPRTCPPSGVTWSKPTEYLKGA